MPNTRRVLLAGAVLMAAAPRRGLTQAAAGVNASWPHTVTGQGGAAVVYQPQVIDWPGQTLLHARAAVSVTRQGTAQPILGTVEVSAATTTDFGTRTVTLTDLRLVTSHFPALDTTAAARLEARLRAGLADLTAKQVPLDTILLSLRDTAEVPSDPAV